MCLAKAGGQEMTPTEKFKKDIETLRESIKLDGIVFEIIGLTPEERAGILEHIGQCLSELQELTSKLKEQENNTART
jgi:hypothetical protein